VLTEAGKQHTEEFMPEVIVYLLEGRTVEANGASSKTSPTPW